MSKFVGIFILGVLAGWVVEWIFVRLFVPNPKKKVELALQASRKENQQLQKQNSELQAALASAAKVVATPEPKAPVAVIAEAVADIAPEPEPTVAVAVDAKLEQVSATAADDDLTKLSGIGPKLAEAMQAAGINGYAPLAAIGVDELGERLSPSGIRYSKAFAESWAAQAKLAEAGDWEGLKAYQAALKS